MKDKIYSIVFLILILLITSCGDGVNSSIESRELPSVQQGTSTELKSMSKAQPSEVDSLLNSSHVTSWAYFRDQSLNETTWKWYISEQYGRTYALGLNNSRHSSWIAMANQGAVASLDFLNKKVSLNPNTATRTSDVSYLAISLVGGEVQQSVNGWNFSKSVGQSHIGKYGKYGLVFFSG